MIVKMIQNIENKMEAWINRLEVRIKEIQKMFNTDLEELRNKQPTMNNETTEIKNTPEEINSRITEGEEWISELGDRTVEITEAEHTHTEKE